MSAENQNRFVRAVEPLAQKFERAFDWRYTPHVLLAIGCILRIAWIIFTPELARLGAIEESLLQLTAARNWSQFGYLYTLFLPDYVMSPLQQQHPVVYTHFPALSALIPSLLQQLGFSVKMIRLFFSAISVVGLLFMFKALEVAFDRTVAVFGLFWSLIFIDPLFIWHDHFDYSFTYLLFFLPAYLLYTRKSLRAVGLCVLVASLLNYKIMITQVTWLCLLSALQNRRRLPKLVLICGGFAALGISLHVLQNAAFLGWNVAWQELIYTIENRIGGAPTTAEMNQWYRDHNMVLWGAPQSLSRKDWFTTMLEPFHAQFKILFRYAKWYALAAAALAWVYGHQRIKRSHFLFCAGLLVMAGSWGLLFPAHAHGYGNVGMESIAPLIILALVCGLAMRGLKATAGWPRGLIFLGLLIFMINSAEHLRQRYHRIFVQERQEDVYSALEKLSSLRGQPVWTNMTSVFVEYFVNQVVPGRCTIQAVLERDLKGCHNLIVNSHADQAALQDFKYFVYSDELTSGNMADGSPERLAEFFKILNRDFETIEKNHFFTVYKRRDAK